MADVIDLTERIRERETTVTFTHQGKREEQVAFSEAVAGSSLMTIGASASLYGIYHAAMKAAPHIEAYGQYLIGKLL